MKTLALTVAAAALTTASAFAHTSLAAHEHPHAGNMLPDVVALAFAALFVGLGFAALRRFRKEEP